jgi:penicillin-binding protein 1C
MKDFKFSNQPIWLKVILLLLAGLLLFLIVVPMPRFNDPTCTVVFSKEGELLGARIADDGQWRFPSTKKLPTNYKKALITFEDSWFYFHPGVNPVSLVRALYLNIRNKKVVSGGSTISMQVARLSRKNPARTIPGKLRNVHGH